MAQVRIRSHPLRYTRQIRYSAYPDAEPAGHEVSEAPLQPFLWYAPLESYVAFLIGTGIEFSSNHATYSSVEELINHLPQGTTLPALDYART